MRYWVKYWVDLLQDEYYFQFTDEEKAFMGELMLIAGTIEKDEKNGMLPHMEKITFMTRRSRESVEIMIKHFLKPKIQNGEKKEGFLSKVGPVLYITNFDKRQASLDPAQRQREHRKRVSQSGVTKRDKRVTHRVTHRDTSVTAPVTHRDVDKIRKEKKRTEIEDRNTHKPTLLSELLANLRGSGR